MSYRRAWLLVDTMNRCFVEPLVVVTGWRGHGAALTAEGRSILGLYRRIERSSFAAVRAPLASIRRRLRVAPPRPA